MISLSHILGFGVREEEEEKLFGDPSPSTYYVLEVGKEEEDVEDGLLQ